MKTIAMVTNTSWNIYNFRLGLLKALQQEGYIIIIIAPTDDYSDRLIELGFEYHNININNKGKNPVEELKLIYHFYKLYKQLKPDVILHYTIKPNIYGSIASAMLDIPAINNISGLGTVFLNESFSSRIARFLYKFALQFPKKVFFQNSDDETFFVQSRLVKQSKTSLLPGSGINPEVFKPRENSRFYGSMKFLFIARLLKDKGIMEYIEAARIIKRKYPDINFSILGAYYLENPTAITEEQMHKWEDEGAVIYLGVSDDVHSIIAEFDCIVLPSYREGLSRVLLEAASMEKPIITTNVPGCKEVVSDGINGYLCKSKDPNDLAQKMKKMINLDKLKRLQMGKTGREKIINQFDEKIVIKKYIKAIEKIIFHD